MNENDDIRRWLFIGTLAVLFPLWVPLAAVVLVLIVIGYCCDKFGKWMARP